MNVVTRFAPSPTGYLHIGGARTALYSWLYARRHGGKFVLRIEDTDQERSTPQAVQAILDGMAWLGLDHDGDVVYQTQRFDRYRDVVEQLLDAGKAYRCYCTKEELNAMREAQRAAKEKPRYDGRCRTRTTPREGVEPVIRFASPTGGNTIIHDEIKGDISVANSELDDLIIARSDGTPTYNFCVVVDDLDMGITHVIRGDDHVNNTPRQINIFNALIELGLGKTEQSPIYAHVPMILGEDGKRLSKRHGAVSVTQYREQGYLPEALLNYLARLGWSHGDQEIFSRAQMVELFDLAHVQHSAATFDTKKLDWVNAEHIKTADAAELAEQLGWQLQRQGVDVGKGPALSRVVEVLRERSKTCQEMAEKAAFFYSEITEYDDKAARKFMRDPGPTLLAQVRAQLAALGTWERELVHSVVKDVAEAADVGMGKVAQPIRIAVSGGAVSPPIDETLVVLGRDQTLNRIDAALTNFNGVRLD